MFVNTQFSKCNSNCLLTLNVYGICFCYHKIIDGKPQGQIKRQYMYCCTGEVKKHKIPQRLYCPACLFHFSESLDWIVCGACHLNLPSSITKNSARFH